MGEKFADLVQNLDFWTQELGKCLLTRSKLDRSHLPNLKSVTIPIKVNKFVHWNQYQRWDGQNCRVVEFVSSGHKLGLVTHPQD